MESAYVLANRELEEIRQKNREKQIEQGVIGKRCGEREKVRKQLKKYGKQDRTVYGLYPEATPYEYKSDSEQNEVCDAYKIRGGELGQKL